MRRRLFFSILSVLLLISACARPDSGASPFDLLAEKFEKQPELPSEPVFGPAFEIIADSEFVYGPSTAGFNISSVIEEGSLLSAYSEIVDEREMTGAEIVEKISLDYSVNPRLLLTVLEYRSGWVSRISDPVLSEFPIFKDDPVRKGLFRQLSWLANELNRGFYSRRVGGLERFSLADGVEVILSPDANDATGAIQFVLGKIMGYQDWLIAIGPLGIHAQDAMLFGPADETAYSQLSHEGLTQPQMVLPFLEKGGWFFTSGPHSAWGDGAAWAALDFAPDEDNYGCYDSDAWVLAVADGLVVRSKDGAVTQNLDGDGHEGSGWIVLYMHIAEIDRAAVGEVLNQGDRIGRPSCEGGPATGTHLHLARKYNGEWIPADQNLPFVLSGWVSSGAGVEYDGTLSRNGQTVNASGFPTDENKINH